MKNFEEKVEKSIKELLKMFETERLPEAIAYTTIKAKAGCDTPCIKWSLGNQLLMMLAGTNDARGIKQWNAVGRRLKVGTKALYILSPRLKKLKSKNDENGETIEKHILTGFSTAPVYRYEDTEGAELEVPDYTPPTLPPLIDVAKKFNINVKYGPFTKRFYGYFQSGRNEIMLCTHEVETFFHELAHGVHNTFKPIKGGQHADQEIVAETVAAVLCNMYGYTGYLYQGYNYIKYYAKATDGKGVVREVLKVLSDIQKVLEIILDNAEAKSEIA